jgi:hypothetical protein
VNPICQNIWGKEQGNNPSNVGYVKESTCTWIVHNIQEETIVDDMGINITRVLSAFQMYK